ncbi:ribonuclease M5 [Bacillus pinisoli]|uniref:ribonuclease M5 n=1 Tax=Bacillus pinisoli TaxID=2901866 RepID=UPI001FF6D1DB|nr:ribonuclease M5 [Bacillus pinisoli]
MKIKEIIVVEGKDDTVAIQRAVSADTIETNGSAINEETLQKIKLAQEKRGVIILTDPDYPGEKIRKTISQSVPGCKHAFIQKNDAQDKRKKKVGVEHASIEVIRQALSSVQQEWIETHEEIGWDELVYLGLVAGNQAKKRRERLGMLLKIGYTNGKQLHKRLQMFQITREQFELAVKQVIQEELS